MQHGMAYLAADPYEKLPYSAQFLMLGEESGVKFTNLKS
jgi:hypothetical protein